MSKVKRELKQLAPSNLTVALRRKDEDTEGKVRTARRWPSANLGDKPQKKLDLPIPSFWTFAPEQKEGEFVSMKAPSVVSGSGGPSSLPRCPYSERTERRKNLNLTPLPY